MKRTRSKATEEPFNYAEIFQELKHEIRIRMCESSRYMLASTCRSERRAFPWFGRLPLACAEEGDPHHWLRRNIRPVWMNDWEIAKPIGTEIVRSENVKLIAWMLNTVLKTQGEQVQLHFCQMIRIASNTRNLAIVREVEYFRRHAIKEWTPRTRKERALWRMTDEAIDRTIDIFSDHE